MADTVATFVGAALLAVVGYRFVRDPRVWGPIAAGRKRRYATWCVIIAGLVGAATIDTVHRARALPPGVSLGRPTGLALACVIAVVVAAIVGGLATLAVATPWIYVLIWAVSGGLCIPAVVPGLVVAAMGEEGTHGIVGTCEHGGSCAAFADGLAGFYAETISLGFATALLFLIGFAAKKIVATHSV